MIVVVLRGRAGNQLFLYAIGRYLANKHRTQLYFDISAHGKGNKIFILPRFNVRMKTVNPLLSVVLRKIIKKRLWKFSWGPFYYEEGHGFDEKVLSLPKTSVLFGYFQSEKYFKAISDIIRNDLSFKDFHADNDTMELEKKILGSDSVSVHVRRGDYLKSRKFNVCTLEYYKKAMEIIRVKVNRPHFYFFSDDILWCMNNFHGTNCTFVDLKQSQQDPLNDMRLMSLCQHNIIANSTYSWWGAWLNCNAQKIVIAPDSWSTLGDFPIEDIICEGWLTIAF